MTKIKARGGHIRNAYVIDVLNAIIDRPSTMRDVHYATGIGHKTVINCVAKLNEARLIEPIGRGEKHVTEKGKGRGAIPLLWAPARRLRQ